MISLRANSKQISQQNYFLFSEREIHTNLLTENKLIFSCMKQAKCIHDSKSELTE